MAIEGIELPVEGPLLPLPSLALGMYAADAPSEPDEDSPS